MKSLTLDKLTICLLSVISLEKKIYNRILGQIAQVAITENTILVPHLWVNSLQLI